MFSLSCIVVVTAVLGQSSEVAVVALGPAQQLEAAVRDAASLRVQSGDVVLAQEEVRARLTGMAVLRQPDEGALARMLADAREREARFDSEGAEELRLHILRAVEQAIRPNAGLWRLAAAAAQDRAAALLAENNRQEAERQALETLRLFPAATLDPAVHPPAVAALFERAAKKLRVSPTAKLKVRSATPAEVMVDGRSLGPTEGESEYELLAGEHRVWLVDARGASLARKVALAEGTTSSIDMSLDPRLELDPVLALDCVASCAGELFALGTRLRVSRLFGVRAPDEGAGIELEVASGEARPWSQKLLSVALPESRARFTPWYLVPCGVGQFAQDRPVFGVTYAAAQVGLLVWHVVALQRHATASAENDFTREPALRSTRNASAIALYGSLLANIAEAVIVGLVTGE